MPLPFIEQKFLSLARATMARNSAEKDFPVVISKFYYELQTEKGNVVADFT
jgi:hypothetical protein